jgi:hypothetical protein
MKKITLLLVMIISAYLVNAQIVTYSTSGVVNGQYYSSTGFVSVSGLNSHVPSSGWKWDVEAKVKRKGFYNIDTVEKIIYYLDKKFKYDTVITITHSTGFGKLRTIIYSNMKKNRSNYSTDFISLDDEPFSFRKLSTFTVWINGRRELYHLK